MRNALLAAAALVLASQGQAATILIDFEDIQGDDFDEFRVNINLPTPYENGPFVFQKAIRDSNGQFLKDPVFPFPARDYGENTVVYLDGVLIQNGGTFTAGSASLGLQEIGPSFPDPRPFTLNVTYLFENGSEQTLDLTGDYTNGFRTFAFHDVGPIVGLYLKGFPQVDNLMLDSISSGPVATLQPPIVIPEGIPEPASWAMLIAGFGIAGSALRRRGGTDRRAAPSLL